MPVVAGIPPLCCDPKGSDGPTRINASFTKAQIGQAGNIRYAPISATVAGNAYGPQQFFSKYQSRAYIINGIDTTTGNHDTGTRAIWSGQVTDGFPSFAAVVAAAKTPNNPLGFIANGGYEATAGLTSLTPGQRRYRAAHRLRQPHQPVGSRDDLPQQRDLGSHQHDAARAPDDMRKRQTLPPPLSLDRRAVPGAQRRQHAADPRSGPCPARP